MTAALLRRQAEAKSISVSAFAGLLLETIVQDGLYNAVLDDGDASQQPPEREIRALDATRLEVVAIEQPNGRLNKRRAA